MAEKEMEEVQTENVENTELQAKQQELDELTDRYKRILAEFENHKKRSQKEREGLYNSYNYQYIPSFLYHLIFYYNIP